MLEYPDPRSELIKLRALYAPIFESTADMRKLAIANRVPRDIFIPASYWLEHATGNPSMHESDGSMTASFVVAALGNWRVTQGIYRFDSGLAKSVAASRIGDTLPSAAFATMPEWCVYVEFEHEAFGVPSAGFWAFVDNPALCPCHANALPADLAAQRILVVIFNTKEGLRPSHYTLDSPLEDELILYDKDGNTIHKSDRGDEYRAINLLLYLCCTNADIKGRPRTAAFIKTRKGERIFPPSAPQIWEIGTRIGPELREAHLRAENEAGHEPWRAVRPHVRRAHWHRYWCGTEDRRALESRWIPPVFVNLSDYDQLSSVVRGIPNKETGHASR